MATTWDLEKIQSYRYDQIEEGHNLEYKSAGALGKDDLKKNELSKDVSAMANAAGGAIIYGMKEKKHLPEKIDPIDRALFSREWLDETITHNIYPTIKNLIIHPIDVNEKESQVVYVVEIPKSTTAHQARDLRYWRRSNTTTYIMTDDQIRDVMNRGVAPDCIVEFDYDLSIISGEEHHYSLKVLVVNQGPKVISHFKLVFSFPDFGQQVNFVPRVGFDIPARGIVDAQHNPNIDYNFTYRSNVPLFPEDEIDIGLSIVFDYNITQKNWDSQPWKKGKTFDELSLKWTLFADEMPTKRDEIPFEKLNNF